MKLSEVKTFFDLLKYIFQKKEPSVWKIIETTKTIRRNYNLEDYNMCYKSNVQIYVLQNQFGELKSFEVDC